MIGVPDPAPPYHPAPYHPAPYYSAPKPIAV